MNKRGLIPGLDDIVKYAIYIIPFILVLAFFVALPTYFFPQKANAEEITRNIISEQLQLLESDDFLEISMQVNSESEDYALVLYSRDASGLPKQCNKESCLCIEKKGMKNCELLPVAACSENKKPCIESNFWEVKKEELIPIPICSTGGKITLGEKCLEEKLS